MIYKRPAYEQINPVPSPAHDRPRGGPALQPAGARMSGTGAGAPDIAATLLRAGAPFELVPACGAAAGPMIFRHAPRTLPEFMAGAGQFRNRPFLLYEGRRYSFGEALDAAAGLAAALRDGFSVRSGTHVGVAMRNSPECVVALLAVMVMGAVPVIANSRGTAEELSDCLLGTRCEVVLADERCAKALAGAVKAAGIPLLVGANAGPFGRFEGQGAASGAVSWETMVAREAQPEAAALVLFTSGTTGRAKAVVLTQRGVMTSVWANQFAAAQIGLQLAARYNLDPAVLAARAAESCLLLVYPLFHTSGLHSGLLPTLARGSRMILMHRWDVSTALRLIQTERVTQMPGVPTMYWDLLRSPDRARYDLSSLTSVSTGGQALPVNLLAEMRRAFPHCVVGNGYGLTEANGAVALVVGEDFLARPSTSGRVLPSCELRIVRDAGGEADRGEPGEIRVRGSQVMAGYWENPEATAATLHDGWLATGDVGYLDEDGFLYIVDRKKDMVISGGENIYCAEVERIIQQQPDVHEVATFGIADERLGERLVAVVVPHAGRSITETQIFEWVAAHLAAYKVPGRVWFQAEGLGRNDLGKIDKLALRRRCAPST